MIVATRKLAGALRRGAPDDFTSPILPVAGDGAKVRIAPVGDPAIITGDFFGEVTEDTMLSDSGTLNVSDPDDGESLFQAQSATIGFYGTFTLTSDGQWTFTLHNSSFNVQSLRGGFTYTESFTVATVGGDLDIVAFTITGTNDAALIDRDDTGSVTEYGETLALGALDINEVDQDENFFQVQTATVTAYGTFSIISVGHWAYQLDNANAAVQALNDGETLTDTIEVLSVDGTSHDVVITINGATETNNPANIGGDLFGDVTEDTMLVDSGTIVADDPDDGESLFQEQLLTNGLYGSFTLTSDGQWTFTLFNGLDAQRIRAGFTYSELFEVTTVGGDVDFVTINVHGTNDVALIYGDDTASVTEDIETFVPGQLSIDELDEDENFFQPQASTTTAYGTFTLAVTGYWTYQLDSANAAVQALNDGETLTDTIEVFGVDGTSHDVVITINGTDEDVPVNLDPVLTVADTLAYTENDLATVIAPGAVLTDVDSPDFGLGTLTISFAANGTGADQLAIRHQGNGAGQIGVAANQISYGGVSIGTFSGGLGGASLVIQLNFGATVAAVEALIRNIAYRNLSDDPSILPRTVRFEVTDGDGGAAIAAATVSVEAVPDPPVLGALGNTINYIEQAGPLLIDSDLTLTDPDSATLTGATVRIAGGFQPGDLLGFVNQNGITGVYANGLLTLSGTASVAAYQAALRSVTFANLTNDNPTAFGNAPNRTINWQVSDGSPLPAGGVFAPAGLYAAGAGATDTAIGDVNGDGKTDLVVTNANAGTVSILIGNGDGTFQPQTVLGVGQNPREVELRDFNGDGRIDLAVTNASAGTVSVLLGTGNGGFGPRTAYTAGIQPTGLAVADINGDGRLDLVSANSGSGNVSVLLGNGDGTFLQGVKSAAGTGPSALAIGDYNGDGRADIVVANKAANAFSILLGTGNGGFSAPTTLLNSHGANDAAAGDLNGDGKLDLVLFSIYAGVTVLLGNGNGSFQAPVGVNAGAGFHDNGELADLNGDGILDLALSNQYLIVTMIGRGDGSFGPPTYLQVPASSWQGIVTIGDVNGDNAPDLAATSYSSATGTSGAQVLLNNVVNLSNTGQSTVTITPVDDPGFAYNDVFAIAESAVFSANVFANSGQGADSDPDSILTVVAINGKGAGVGTQITLASGARLTLNANGSFTYDTNHAFDSMPTLSSGASNTARQDSFTYTLAGGATATVTFNLTGLDTNDELFGTAGADILVGGVGNDIYNFNHIGDQAIEVAGGGDDRIRTSVSYTLVAGAFIETLEAAAGTGPIGLTGNGFNQTLIGNAGANTLDGRGGDDIMMGGGGNDVYFVDSLLDQVIEAAGAGSDRVTASVSWILAAGSYVEFLEAAAGTAAIALTGNALAQTITGNAGGNILTGGGGADLLRGLAGDDIYQIDAAGPIQIEESIGGGFDAIVASVSFSLLGVGSNPEIERMTTVNAAATTAISLTGNFFNQTIVGNAGGNTLNGGGGADILQGLGGSDTYVVDNVAVQVVETIGNGNADRILTSVSYTLAANCEVEYLTAALASATTALVLTGNAFGQSITGNAGANILNGGGGPDTLYGLGGNDIYYVGVSNEQAIESSNQGYDIVYASASYTLAFGTHIELLAALTPGATSSLYLTGNALAQEIRGNAGANSIRGGGGADMLFGLGGDDTYEVNDAAAQVIEGVGQGFDAVFASVSYALGAAAEIETLRAATQSATNALNLTGSNTRNDIRGNNGANILDGKGDADDLWGFAGADIFRFTTALGTVDRIMDFQHGIDRIQLDDAIFTALAPGALAAGQFVVGGAAADGNDRIIYNAVTGQLFYDADGSGSGGAIQFASLQTGLLLTASDFAVI